MLSFSRVLRLVGAFVLLVAAPGSLRAADLGTCFGEPALQQPFVDADGQPLPFECAAEVEEFLNQAESVSSKRLGKGPTDPLRVLLESDGIRAHACFRRVDKEFRNERLDDGRTYHFLRDSFRHELAAYELSELLGLGTVPPVVARRFGGTDGSLQLWLEDTMSEKKRLERKLRPPNALEFGRQLWRMQIFDSLVSNIDRNLGNILIDAEWRIWYIDHTRAFARYRSPREPEPGLGLDPIFWERLRTVDDSAIRAAIEPYVESFAVDSVVERRRHIVDLFEERLDTIARSRPAKPPHVPALVGFIPPTH